MARTSNTGALSLAYANPNPHRARARTTPVRGVRVRVRVRLRDVDAMVAAAVGWLVLGCGGLLSAIAFTADQRSLTVALAVWGLGFVAPSVLATVVAYRLEEQGLARHDD
jgi:hypothetical protein